MEKEVIKRNVNEDYIPIVRKEIAKLKYQEVDIIKEHQELISKINEVLNNDNISLFVLPNSVTEMGTDNFYACKSLKRVVLSSSMKEIPSWSFNNCSSLEQVVIPRSIKKIGNGAFKGCSSLISLSLPSSIEEIGDNIFDNCEKIKKIYIPKSSKERFEKLLWQYKDKLIGTNG